ncbi:hypothetical protein LJC54_09465 [Parabacteroides sp. OttesenSCG-928-J18]|nr:hypothetical protein [Parabacteroides sp. OttesenSCG-928-J18]
MKRYWKEIVLSLVIACVAVWSFWYVYDSIQWNKKMEATDLYTLVAEAPEQIVAINRLRTPWHSDPLQVFIASIPEIYLSLAAKAQPCLLSFHADGLVLYAKTDRKNKREIEKTILHPQYGAYLLKQRKGDITYTYYPDKGNGYFGYFVQEGILVASHSRRLLEEVAGNLAVPNPSILGERSIDENVPVNILLAPEKIDLRIVENDSLIWQMPREWVTVDLFVSERKRCVYLPIPKESVTDSLFYSVTDSISYRLERLFPSLALESQQTEDENFLYYTGCFTPHRSPEE